MKLTFQYVPVDDLDSALRFYRDELGLDEAWREGSDTVAFALPSSDVQVMVDRRLEDGPTFAAGPMYAVEDVVAWAAEHPGVDVLAAVADTGPIRVGTFADPGGNVFHVFDLPG